MTNHVMMKIVPCRKLKKYCKKSEKAAEGNLYDGRRLDCWS